MNIFVWLSISSRKKKTLSSTTEPNEPIDTVEMREVLDHSDEKSAHLLSIFYNKDQVRKQFCFKLV